jgi:hypothetical protein
MPPRQLRLQSSINQLEKDYAQIIMNSRDGDGTGMLTSRMFTRHTFTMIDGSRLQITEEISGGVIEVSYYNWLDPNGSEIIKFHSEPHDGDKRYQTATEPHHIHPPEEAKLTNRTRYPNFHHQEL